MRRYQVAIEGEINVLESDLTDDRYVEAGYPPPSEKTPTPDDTEVVACYVAGCILGPTGLGIDECHVVGSDER